jgi:hypothetical protein
MIISYRHMSSPPAGSCLIHPQAVLASSVTAPPSSLPDLPQHLAVPYTLPLSTLELFLALPYLTSLAPTISNKLNAHRTL